MLIFVGNWEIELLIDEVVDSCPAGEPRPSARTVMRWVESYLEEHKETGVAGGLVAIADKRSFLSGNSTDRISSKVSDLIWNFAYPRYANRLKRTLKFVYKQLCGHIDELNRTLPKSQHLPRPSYETLRRRFKRVSQYELLLAREGRAAAHAKYGAVQKLPPSEFLMEVVEIDHQTMDIVLSTSNRKITFKVTLTLVIEQRTRAILGFYIGYKNGGVDAILSALRMAVNSKAALMRDLGLDPEDWPCMGLPSRVIVDNGADFRADALQQRLSEVGIDVSWGQTYTPQAKAFVERAFRTINTSFIENLPGRTKASPAERGTYDSVLKAELTLDEIRAALAVWIVTDYMQSPHEGLDGLSPLAAWREEAATTPVDPVLFSTNLALYRHDGPERINREGVFFKKVRYILPKNSTVLEDKERGHIYRVAYDPSDVSSIILRDLQTGEHEKLWCARDDLHGLSFELYDEMYRGLMLHNKQLTDQAISDSARQAYYQTMRFLEGSKKPIFSAKFAERVEALKRFNEHQNGLVGQTFKVEVFEAFEPHEALHSDNTLGPDFDEEDYPEFQIDEWLPSVEEIDHSRLGIE